MLGFIQDEIVRRLTGNTLGQMWRQKIAEPLGLEAWIGLPESEFGRVARLYPGKQSQADVDSEFYKQLNTPDSLVKRAFASPRGMQSVREMNEPRAWQAGFPAMGGVGTAAAVASSTRRPVERSSFSRPRCVSGWSAHAAAEMTRSYARRRRSPVVFSSIPWIALAGKHAITTASPAAPSAIPVRAAASPFGDPENGLSFCYVMNQMELCSLPRDKCLDLVKALYVL